MYMYIQYIQYLTNDVHDPDGTVVVELPGLVLA